MLRRAASGPVLYRSHGQSMIPRKTRLSVPQLGQSLFEGSSVHLTSCCVEQQRESASQS
ncbi:hypothetical protein BOSEA31B_20461 [Hyphomicrobiales bacterium]|nr:hypothetical protein BOSEA31B_20461 [Hyphomicrobiales bacterium]